jgi:hypothetical protein
MANRITISALGPRPLSGGPELSHAQALERMKQHWSAKLDAVVPDKPDLVVVPEASDRFPEMPLDQRLDYYRCRGDQMREFWAVFASANRCYVAYSAARQVQDGSWRNSTQLLDRAGQLAGVYNKNHLVIEETTKAGILCGKEAQVIACDFGKVACAICFDLNFDELRLTYAAQKPDLVLFCSMYHGGMMQNYWAYSCRAHLVGAVAGAQCTVISPLGQLLAASTNYFDSITARVNLDCAVVHLDYNWGRLRALKQKYGRGVTVTDPGYLGAVLVTSETDGVSVQEMVREFEIERLDDYWERARAHRRQNTEP